VLCIELRNANEVFHSKFYHVQNVVIEQPPHHNVGWSLLGVRTEYKKTCIVPDEIIRGFATKPLLLW
jgi:hypothetical protein